MRRALFIAAGATLAASASQHSIGPTHGVPPSLLSSYTPSSTSGNKTWKCLTSGETIAWSAVNDDYCDCQDGSDEPGTGACRDTTFYCQNKGHIGASIHGSRVRDGLCEKECCDGSDEAPGVCPDTCAELGKEHRAKIDALNKLRRTGSKIRASYITFAQKEKRRLELEIEKTAGQVKESEAEVERLRDIATRAESLSAATLNHLKLSPLYTSLTTHSLALKSLRAQHNNLVDEHAELESILSSLRESFNPNYQDMGVLAAVRAYEKIAGLPHINDVRNAADEADGTVVKTEEEEVTIPADDTTNDGKERLWNATELEDKLDDLIKSDTESLLLEHDKHAASPASGSGESLLFDLGAYVPDSIKPQYETIRNTLLSFLGAPQATKSEADNEALTRARAALSEAETALRNDKSAHDTAKTDLSELFSPSKFGTQGEWKKLHNNCLTHDSGEYTYEVCLFEEAKQKPGPGKGGGTFSLGRFEGWSGEEGLGERIMKFGDGARCWNGPARSVQVRLKCGTENALLSVAELEKCEYEITGTSPALCMPLGVESGDVKKEEL